jgi:hypothetical protein
VVLVCSLGHDAGASDGKLEGSAEE